MATMLGASADTAAGAIADADTVSVGSGGYTTAMPSDANITADYGNPPAASEIYTTSNATGPIPSNDWWSTIVLGTQGDPHGQGSITGLPYHADTNQRGMTIQYPRDWFGDPAEQAFLKSDYVNTPKLTIGHTGNSSFADSRADDWGDWHVRTRWGDGTSTSLDVTFAKGSPLFYAEYAGGDAEITLETKDSSAGSPTLVDSSNINVWADRGNVLGITVTGITADSYQQHYGIFAPSGATWSGVGGATLTSALNGQGYVTVALLPDNATSTLDLFEQYAYNFVRDTTVNWDYVETDANGNPVSEVRTTYQFSTENKAESATAANESLTCLFPHQWKHTSAALTGHSYFSPRGELRLHEGASFTTTMPYRGVLPFMSDEGSYNTSTLASYVDDLEAAPFWQNGTGSDTDTYFSGKDLNRTKQAIPIAQQVGDTAARDSFLGALETRLASWFSVNDTFNGTAEEEEVFYYHDTIGSLIGFPDGFGSSTILNDHHFHYGYMINAAAEIARMDDTWVQNYGDMVELVIREYMNWDRPSGTDPHSTLPVDSPSDAFPFMRNFDPYSGHSWAGGNGAAADCNNQESSSEAINAYAGIIKWAEYTGNTAMRDAAIYAYTHEVHAIWDYWFNPSHDSFPNTWGDNVNDNSIGGPDFNYASIVWGTGYDHHVFWATSDVVEVFGINWLPVNAHSLYLGWDTTYADGNWGDLVRTRGSDTNFLGGWKTAAWGYRALHNASDAVTLAEAELPLDDTNGSGASSAFTYHWVHNLNNLGTVDTSIVADVPMHAVFDNGGSKTYVAYNPTSSTRTVTFSDGFTMDVPANAQKTSNGNVTEGLAGGGSGGDTTAPTAPTNLSSPSQGTNSVDLNWDASSDSGTGVDHYNVLVNGALDHTVTTTSTTVSGLSSGTSYDFQVEAVDGAGNVSSPSGTLTVSTSSGSSSPYSSTDVGAVDVAGSTSGTSSSLTVEGAGADIWGSADEFHYAYQEVSGDVTVTANVTGVENTNAWAKAGVMVRESLNADSAHGMAAVTPGNGTAFQRRTSTGGSTAHTAGSGSSGSYWVRIERSGDTITAYESADGASWSQIGSATIAMTDPVYVGMPVTSHSSGTLCTATFESIAIDTGTSDTQAPSAPANLTSPAKTDTSVDLSWDASSDSGTGVDHYNVYVNGGVDHTVAAGTTSTTVTGLSSGTSYDFNVSAVDGAGNESSLSTTLSVTTDTSSSQSAFNGPHNVPGVVEAEDFDTGGEGVAYHDTTTANDGGASYRSTAVDIESSTENGYNICWTDTDEWWEYTVQVDTGGTYDVNLRVASDLGGGSFHVEVDGTDVTGTVSFAATGGWQAWTTVSAGSVDLTAGEHVIRVYSHANDWNLNWIEFASSGDTTAPSTPSGLSSTGTTDSSVSLSWNAASDTGGSGLSHYNVYVNGAVDHTVAAGTTSTTVSGLSSGTSYDFQVSAVDGAGNESGLSSVLTVTTDTSSSQSAYNGPHTLPGTVQAEDFDTGGSGVAFSDSDSANNGGAYRSTAVDIEGATEGGYNIGWTAAGEWLEYTVSVDADGTYDMNARVASSGGGGAFRVEVDGTDVTGTISVAGTGGWQTWATVSVSGIDLTAGEHVLRVYVESAGFNLNWLEFVQTSSGGTSYSGTAGNGWSATVSQVGTNQYEWSFSPSNSAGWADIHFADPGTDAWVGYRMDDSDGDNVHLYTRDTSNDGSSIDFRFVWDDGAGGQYMSARQNHTY